MHSSFATVSFGAAVLYGATTPCLLPDAF